MKLTTITTAQDSARLHQKSLSLDVRGLEQLKSATRATQNSPEFEQAIKQSAEQFESLFLKWVLDSLRKASPDGGLLNNQATQAYQNMYDQELVQHLSGKGLGLAGEIERQLKRLVNNNS